MAKHELVTQSSARPTTKVLAGMLSGGAGTAVIGVLAALQTVDTSTFWGALVAYAATTIAAYMKRNRVPST